MYNHILSIILFTPLVGAILLMLMPKENKDAIRWVGNIFGCLGFAVSLPLSSVLGAKGRFQDSSLSRARPTTGFPPSAQAT